MQLWGAREGGGGREGTRQRPRWDRWREGAGRRWAEPDARPRATGGLGCGETQLPPGTPPPGCGGQRRRAGLWRADRQRPPGRWARDRDVRAACARLCAQGGRTGGGTWMPAWRASPGRWVRRAAGCGRPGLEPRLSSGGPERRGLPAWLLRGRSGTPPPRRADPGGGRGLPVGGGRSQAVQRAGETGSRYPVGENGVGVEGAGMGAGFLPGAPLPRLIHLQKIIFKYLFCARQELGSPLRGGFHGNNNCQLPCGESALPWQPHPHLPKVLGVGRR